MEDNYVKGTCLMMCPIKEAQLRQKENLLHKFEMKKGTECSRRPQYDPNRTVKSFSRSVAGAETTNPANLRPYSVLLKTVEYLCKEIFPLHKEKPLIVYNFMFDRFRAVRQDMVIQNLSSVETIKVLEPIVKFLMYFGYILVEESSLDFDSYINNTHLQECLKRLLVCYRESDVCVTSRWEIESAYLLFNLGNVKPLTRGIQLCESQQTDEGYLFSLELSLQWYLKNYFKVFKMLAKLPPLLMCVVHNWIPEIRRFSFQALCHAYSSANSSYPVSQVKSLMLFESDSQVLDECRHYNIGVSEGRIHFLKKDFDFSAKSKSGGRLKLIDVKLQECDLVRMLYNRNE